MSIPKDTPAICVLRQQDPREPCPYIYFQLSPIIRSDVARNRQMFLWEWGSFLLLMAGLCVAWALRFLAGDLALLLWDRYSRYLAVLCVIAREG